MSKRKKSSSKNTFQNRSETSVPSTMRLYILAGVAIIVLAAFVAYLPSINGGFILDDDGLLTTNELIKASNGLCRIWFTTEAMDYWPVTNTSFWFEWRLWGMNPAGYHVTNLTLHIAGVLLIWIILRSLSIPGAFLAAMIFAVHPVNVESVAWISQRKNTMSMLFFLLSILCYVKHLSADYGDNAQSSSRIPCADAAASGVCSLHTELWYWLSLAAFVLAMLSKGSVAVLPVLLLGIIWWLRSPSEKKGTGTSLEQGLPGKISCGSEPVPFFSWWLRPLTMCDLVRTSPFFAVAIVLTGVNLWFQTNNTEEVIRTATFMERMLGAGGVIWFYLYKALLPVDLAFTYPQWHIETSNPLWWLPVIGVLATSVVLWWYKKSWSRQFLFAWVFFCVALVPVLGFTDVGFMKYSLVADHYQHIAIIGVIALAAALWSIWRQHLQETTRHAATVVAVLATVSLAFLTWHQNRLYSDAITLYQDTLKKNPECWMIHNNLGNVLAKLDQLQEVIKHYEQALRIKPDQYNVHHNLGNVLVETGKVQKAIEHFQQALHLKPNSAEAHYDLAIALAMSGRPTQAIEHFQQALDLKTDYPQAHYNMGIALAQVGRLQEAIEHFKQAVRLDPDSHEAHRNLGNLLLRANQPNEAINHFHIALALKPDNDQAHNDLGAALIQVGKPHEAIDQLKQAIRLNPKNINAYLNMASAYAIMQQSTEAIITAQQALELARSEGQEVRAKQVEDWLNSYHASLSDSLKQQPTIESTPLPP